LVFYYEEYLLELNIDLVGCSFYAGTQCHSPPSYKRALITAHRLFDIAYQQFNFSFNVLDIAGGSNPDDTISSHIEETSHSTFTNMAATIQLTIDQLFPLSRGNQNILNR
jgi:diaminopimelate decarboxylase